MTSQYVWRPQAGTQYAYVGCPVAEIFFGGARGGGKTDASLGRALFRALKYKADFKAHFIRRELTQLEPAIARSKQIYSNFGSFNETKKRWDFNGGGSLHFRYIERDADAEKFQGDSCTDLYFEEIGNFPDLAPLLKLKGILRSTAGVPSCFCATGNPGGPGHSLVKRRYIDPAPLGWTVIPEKDELTGLVEERIYIPSRITDNKLLMKNDPGYLSRLARTGSAALVRAWLNGDFDAIEGAFFEKFEKSSHVLRRIGLPRHWNVVRAGDWGSYYPFYFCWGAVASEDWVHPDGAYIPKGAIVVFNEWYGSRDHNNVGLKMPAADVGEEVARRDRQMGVKPTIQVMDPSAFKQDGGPSVAERMAKATNGKVFFHRADNRIQAKNGAMGGWDVMRERINGVEFTDEVSIPTLFFMDNCVDAIRTIPALQHDPSNPEKLMGVEDHPADAIRYMCMSRPWEAKSPVKPKLTQDFRSMTLDQLWASHSKSKTSSASWRV
jgi:hypothetical protein